MILVQSDSEIRSLINRFMSKQQRNVTLDEKFGPFNVSSSMQGTLDNVVDGTLGGISITSFDDDSMSMPILMHQIKLHALHSPLTLTH